MQKKRKRKLWREKALALGAKFWIKFLRMEGQS